MPSALTDPRALARFYEAAVRLGIYSTTSNLRRHLRYLFDGVELRGQRLLDVGGGAGLLAVYAAVRGAEAVCVEPEAHGSTSGVTAKFSQLRLAVGPQLAVELVSAPIQDYLSTPRRFDVVVIANAINHLNEEACIRLRVDPAAQSAYQDLFSALFRALNPGGWLIATDCSSANFFSAIGVRSPFMPDIEWHKHQPPRVWDRLLQRCGFAPATVRWSAPNTLGWLGRLVFGNRVAAYFVLSHFRLAARKPLSASPC